MNKFVNRLFGEDTSSEATNDKTRNWLFIGQQVSWFNERLYRDGYVFVNDFLRGLGLKLRKDGYRYGWIFGKDVISVETQMNHSEGRIKIWFNCRNIEDEWMDAHIKSRRKQKLK